mgnify:CR=1 FL=1
MPLHSQRHALFCFGSVSFAYFAYAGLFSTYAPLWLSSLGFGTLAIGSMASLQSGTRLFSPYVWGWLADHSHNRIRLLRLALAPLSRRLPKRSFDRLVQGLAIVFGTETMVVLSTATEQMRVPLPAVEPEAELPKRRARRAS